MLPIYMYYRMEFESFLHGKSLSKTLPSADRCSHWTFCNPVCWLPLFCSPFYDNCTNCSMIMAMMGPTEKEVAGGTTVLYDKSNSHFCRQPFFIRVAPKHLASYAGSCWSHQLFSRSADWSSQDNWTNRNWGELFVIVGCYWRWKKGEDKGSHTNNTKILKICKW